MSIFEYIKNEMTIEEFASFLLDISCGDCSVDGGLFINEVLFYLEDDISQKYICEDNKLLESVIEELKKEIKTDGFKR